MGPLKALEKCTLIKQTDDSKCSTHRELKIMGIYQASGPMLSAL